MPASTGSPKAERSAPSSSSELSAQFGERALDRRQRRDRIHAPAGLPESLEVPPGRWRDAILADVGQQAGSGNLHLGERQRLVGGVAAQAVAIATQLAPVLLLDRDLHRIAVELEIAVADAASSQQLFAFAQDFLT